MRQTAGQITHFVSSMGTTGTSMGCSRYFKEVKPEVEIVGLQPAEGAQIPGIRRWPKEYLPSIFDEEGIFAGMSSGGDRYLSTGVFDPPPPAHHSCYYKNLDLTLSQHRKALPEDMPLFMLFTAPWCPDCTTTLPIVNEIFTGQGAGANFSLLRCIVGKTREEWKDPRHPFRSDTRWGPNGLSEIPTLACLGTASSPLVQPRVLSGLEKIDREQVRFKVESFLKEQG
ncbi:Cysteine synthase B (CSase B) (O-acetylserine (thiol)-lyase B) (OAS-TL B) (O-acetylserine sulfhydrylase B) [Durusdinium trenchii]